MSRVNNIIVALLLVGFASSNQATADVGLNEGLTRLAKKVSEFLRNEGRGTTVLVGDFSAPPRLEAAGGAGLRKLIEDALKKEGLQIGKDAQQIMGKFTVRDEVAHQDDNFESVALRITVDVLDRDDEELGRLKISVFGDSALQFVGGNGDIPLDLPPKKREEAKRKSINSPSTLIDGDETKSLSGLFGFEIRVRQGNSDRSAARTPKVNDGRAFVDLVKGEEYIVRLHNHANFEAAVTLTVDGLNMFAFSEEGNFGSQVLIPSGKFVDIPGWYINSQQTDVFEISTYSKSAAAEKNVPVTSIGVITATFHESVEGSSRDPKATARGRRIGKKYVRVNRVIKDAQAVISVRYER